MVSAKPQDWATSVKKILYIYIFFSNRIYQGQKVTAPLGEKNPILKKYIEINTESRSKGLRPTAEANVNGWMVAWLYSVELGGNYLSLNDSFFVPLAFFSRLMLIFSYSLSNQIFFCQILCIQIMLRVEQSNRINSQYFWKWTNANPMNFLSRAATALLPSCKLGQN